MRPWRGNCVWQIVYPIAMYYVIYNILYTLFRYLFRESESALFCLGLASMLTIPFLYSVYKRAPVLRPAKWFERQTIVKELLYILSIIIFGIVLNIIISHTPLAEQSAQFAKANATLLSGNLVTKVYANCICIPILEEIVYRGIVCGQLQIWTNQTAAVVISAFLFGIMHFNLVQFLYGFLVGLVLSYVYTKTNKLWVVILAHSLTNLIVVIFHV